MSYCVHCGVELAKGLEECPLCNTPVIDPRELELRMKDISFPESKGPVETVKRRDMAFFLSALFLTIAVTCGVLNAFIFPHPLWSLAVIGACVVLWVCFVPVMLFSKLTVYASICLDGLSVAVYLYLIARMVDSYRWFFKLGLPIVLLAMIIVEVIFLCVKKLSKSFLAVTLYLFSALGIFCIGLDLMIDYYLKDEICVSWSTIVLTVCIVVDVAIGVVMSSKRLRGAVRRRFHL